MKVAMISSIFKGGSRLEVSNYRPVSVLPILSKFLERHDAKSLCKNDWQKFLMKMK